MRTTPAGGRSLKGYHISGHLLLLRAELEYLCINQDLENILEGMTTLGGMPNYHVIQTVVGIIYFANFFWALSFWKFEFVALVQQLEQRDDMFVVEGVLLAGASLVWILF